MTGTASSPGAPAPQSCDLDHVVALDAGGPTSTYNLTPLCRRHHRAKTHTRWHHDADDCAGPGHHRWTSPMGPTFTVDPTGTAAADPPTSCSAQVTT